MLTPMFLVFPSQAGSVKFVSTVSFRAISALIVSPFAKPPSSGRGRVAVGAR